MKIVLQKTCYLNNQSGMIVYYLTVDGEKKGDFVHEKDLRTYVQGAKDDGHEVELIGGFEDIEDAYGYGRYLSDRYEIIQIVESNNRYYVEIEPAMIRNWETLICEWQHGEFIEHN